MRNTKVIAERYVRGWFVVDFVSILPVWIVSFNEGSSSSDGAGSSSVLQLVRVVKGMFEQMGAVLRFEMPFDESEVSLGFAFIETFAFMLFAIIFFLVASMLKWKTRATSMKVVVQIDMKSSRFNVIFIFCIIETQKESSPFESICLEI